MSADLRVVVPVTLDIPGFDHSLPWPVIEELHLVRSKTDNGFDVMVRMLGHTCTNLRVNAIGLETVAMAVQHYQRKLLPQQLKEAAVQDYTMTVNRGGNNAA